MFNSWFSSKSSSASRHSQPPQTSSSLKNSPSALKDTHSGPTDFSSISQSTLEPPRFSGTITSSQSAIPLAEVHTHINDPSIYAHTPSLTHGTPRTSDEPRNFDDKVGDSTVAATKVDTGKETLYTPHDAIIAEVFGRPVNELSQPQAGPDTVNSTSPHPHPPQASISLTTSHSPLPPPSTPAPAPSSRPTSTITIYDPFSGVKLGEHTLISPSKTAQDDSNLTYAFPTTGDPKLWARLERILELQAEIAGLHADMEGGVGRGSGNTGGSSSTGDIGRTAEAVGLGFGAGIGGAGVGSTGATSGKGGKARSRKRMKRGETLPVGDDDKPEYEGGVADGAVTDASIDHFDDEGDEADDEEDDIHGYGKKRRDEEFARLAEQFAERKEAIGGIMNTLDDLSAALKAFHALPTPILDLATPTSRTNTMSSTASNTSKASSSPPHGLYFGQPSSPLSSFSPSHVGTSFSPLGATFSAGTSFSPPPPSTLAPLVLPVEPRVLPELELVTTASLPQATSPKIIAEARNVQSPIDTHLAQSVFRGAVSG
ncbi:hypothetical protein BS17DRAFT_600338 [Gyrodon lividus]|nr:hypothetical protein BS17DRAFT_600338 [Gyrodon lividus]